MTDPLPLDGINDPWQWSEYHVGWVRAWHVSWTPYAGVNGNVFPDYPDMRSGFYAGNSPASSYGTQDAYYFSVAPEGADPIHQSGTLLDSAGGWSVDTDAGGNSSLQMRINPSAGPTTEGQGVFFVVQYEPGFAHTTVPHPELDPTVILTGSGYTVIGPYDFSAPPITPTAPVQPFLRHASRHVHQTVAKRVKDGLTALDWTDPTNTPLGAPAVTFQTTPLMLGGRPDTKILAGLVSITLGDEINPLAEEMGGPLYSQEYPIFVDVFGNTDGETTALACDVRDIFLGRFEFAERSFAVVDQVTGTDVPGWRIELEDVERARPDNTFALFWQVVKVTATVYYPEAVF